MSILLLVSVLASAVNRDFNVQRVESSQTAESQWPMFQHDPQHTGRSPYIGPYENPKVGILLGNETVDEHFGFPVIDSDGNLYLTKRMANGDPSLCAFSPDGIQKWVYESPSGVEEPTLSESTGTVYLMSNNRRLCALDMENGTVKWEKSYIYIYQQPTINDDGITYFLALCELANGTRRTTLIGLDHNGTEVLNFDIGPNLGSPYPTRTSVDRSDIVYFGFNDTLYAVSPSGVEEWRRKFETIEGFEPMLPHPEVGRTPVIADDGTLFVVVFGESGDRWGSVQYLHAIDPNDPMTDKWTYTLGYQTYVPSSPSIDISGNLYILTGRMFHTRVRYSLTKIDPTGTRQWFEHLETWYGNPGVLLVDALCNIYVTKTETSGRLHIFDDTGSQKMVYCGREDLARQLSLAADGTLYVAGDEHLYTVTSVNQPRIGLLVDLSPMTVGPYYVGDIVEFEISVTNPTDTTGINLQATDVRVTIIEPSEIDVRDGWSGVTYANIAPGESKSTTFEAEATGAGENIKIKANAIGQTSLGAISGSANYYFAIHDPATPKPDWSFAIIADLHIGYGSLDYGAEGFADGNTGGDYSLTRTLEIAVGTIIVQKDHYNIRFVVVLGDISDTAEESEFLKAKEILNRLNDPDGDGNSNDGIPYIPLMGNHDTCPYTQKDNYEDRPWPWDYCPGCGNVEMIATYGGDKIFHRVFWEDNPTNNQLIFNKIDNGFEKQPAPVEWWDHYLYLENYAFSYGGINFVSIDVAERAYGHSHRHVYPVSSLAASWGMWSWTQEFLESHVREYQGDPIMILSHFPLWGLGGFFQHQYLANLLFDNGYSSDTAYTFGGHRHRNAERIQDLLDWKGDPVEPAVYRIIETEALSQIRLRWPKTSDIPLVESTHSGKSIRIVQVKDGGIDYSTILNPSNQIDILFPHPSFDYSYASLPEPNEAVTFAASFTTYHGFHTSFQWNFGDGHYGSGSSTTHSYLLEGDYNVTLTVTSTNLVTEEQTNQTVTRHVCVRSKHLFSPLPPDLHITSIMTEEDLSQVAKNVWESAFVAKNVSGEMMLIAMIDVDFAEASADIDISSMIADMDHQEGKSILYMPSWPEEIGENKLLFIPSRGTGTVYICPNATSLEEVDFSNSELTINVGETKEGITVTTGFYNGREYYVISGVTGTGGGETILGDINGDGIVELTDFFLASQAFGSTPGDPNWNRYADINGDNIVELMDFWIMSEHFGESW